MTDIRHGGASRGDRFRSSAVGREASLDQKLFRIVASHDATGFSVSANGVLPRGKVPALAA